jgi:hypothetical protein
VRGADGAVWLRFLDRIPADLPAWEPWRGLRGRLLSGTGPAAAQASEDVFAAFGTPKSPAGGNIPNMTTPQPWPWPETMDALLAAPASHRLLLENDRVRVLDVVIEPGAREPEHTHQAASLMIIDEPARIRYYTGSALLFESQARSESQPGVRVRWMEPEGPHSVENIDEHRYHAIRIELK